MADFKRRLSTGLISDLQKESLFTDWLLPDVKRGDVFPAIRNNRVDFYHGGGKLFSYSKDGFYTHIKYASVLSSEKNYVMESEIEKLPHIKTFAEQYTRIKENCRRYSGAEAKGVSDICRSFGRLLNGEMPQVIPLDIEVCFDTAGQPMFEEEGQSSKTDRIDILFYHTEKRQLRFCEAKHFSNSEIWAPPGQKPAVVRQLERYEKQVLSNKDKIKNEYVECIDKLNELLGCALPTPESIDETAPVFLLVFGFDADQRGGRLKDLLIDDGSLNGHDYYFVGGIGKINLVNMWNGVRRGK